MIKLKQCTEVAGDETAGYEVTLDKRYTVEEFINEVVSKKQDWGYIGIKQEGVPTIFGSPKCEYKWGKLLSSLPNEYLNKEISIVSASGGWSRMDYLITIIN